MFDPFARISEWVIDLRDMLLAMIKVAISSSQGLFNDPSVQMMYRIALEPTGMFAWMIIVYSIFMTFVTFKSTGRIVYALIVALVVAVLAPMYVSFMIGMRRYSLDITRAIDGMFSTESTLSSESLGNPGLDLASFGLAAAASLPLVGHFYTEEYMYAAAMFLLPLAFALSAAGPRTRAVANIFASISLVFGLIGRPAAILVIELFEWLSATSPESEYAVFVQNIVLAMSFVAAYVLQILLVIACFVTIKQVQGAIRAGVSRINSDVRTSVRNTVRIRNDKNRNQSRRPMPVVVVPPAARPSSVTREISKVTSTAIVTAGIKAVAAGATAATKNPKVGAVVLSTGKTIQQARANAKEQKRQAGGK